MKERLVVSDVRPKWSSDRYDTGLRRPVLHLVPIAPIRQSHDLSTQPGCIDPRAVTRLMRRVTTGVGLRVHRI